MQRYIEFDLLYIRLFCYIMSRVINYSMSQYEYDDVLEPVMYLLDA